MSNKITMPWEERPAGCKDVMWLYSENPVKDRYHIPSSNSIFNSAVVPFKDGYAGVFRCDNRAVQMNIFAGFSKDGIHWEIEHEPIKFKAGNTDMIESEYKYDPRVTWIDYVVQRLLRPHHRHRLYFRFQGVLPVRECFLAFQPQRCVVASEVRWQICALEPSQR